MNSAGAQIEPPEHHNKANHPRATRHNSTNIDLIQDAIKAIDLRKDGAGFSYREVAKRFSVS